jgi:hypothetical protein
MSPHLGLRLHLALALLGAALPGLAQERSRPPAPPPPAAPSQAEPAARPPPPPSSGAPSTRPPPPPGGSQQRPPPAYLPPAPGYVPPPPPYWYGWGWGWGYAPLWGWAWWPASPAPVPAAPSAPADRVVSTLRGSGMNGDGSGGSLAFAAEGRRTGFRFSVDGLTPDRIDGAPRLPGTEPMAYGTAAVTWSIAAAEAYRLRVEAGGSMLAVPDTGSYAGKDYGGTTAFGLLLGLSGQLGLVGPLGIEGHLRVTPYPVPVVDAGVALALRVGPLAFTGGWRELDVSSGAASGPEARLSGPELGLAVVF